MLRCELRFVRLCKALEHIRWLSTVATSPPSTSAFRSSSEQQYQQFTESVISESEAKQDHKRFAELFRRSKFTQLGDFEGRIVIGEIVRRIADDLYIDIGLKFYAVCKAPTMKNDSYMIGAKVLLRLHDPELSELFLGSTKELTLLEADATLLGLYRTQSDKSNETAFISSIEKEVNRIKNSTTETVTEPEKFGENASSE